MSPPRKNKDVPLDPPTLSEVIRRLDAIDETLKDWITKQSAVIPCPQPGLCLRLQDSHAVNERRIAKIETDLRNDIQVIRDKEIKELWTAHEKVKDNIGGIKVWIGSIGGGMALFTFLAMIFGPIVRKLLHLE